MYKKSYYGTVSYMPGLFGLHMASVVIREIGQEAKLFYTSKRRHLHRQVQSLIPSTMHGIDHRASILDILDPHTVNHAWYRPSSINPRHPRPSYRQPCMVSTIEHQS
jgi:hypothetical protein